MRRNFINLNQEHHTVIECVPIHQDLSSNAPIYFKKAITESESEWAHHKKLIDTKDKGVRKCIPPRFPYFSVQFGMTQGMAHVIEKENKFKKTFGLEVIAGIIGNDTYFTTGRQSRLSKQEETENVKKFLKKWLPFDWTKELDGGNIDAITDA